jgi:hypothetical protein
MRRTDDCGIPDKYPDEGSLIALRDDRNDHERCASNRQRRIAWKDFFLPVLYGNPDRTLVLKVQSPLRPLWYKGLYITNNRSYGHTAI